MTAIAAGSAPKHAEHYHKKHHRGHTPPAEPVLAELVAAARAACDCERVDSQLTAGGEEGLTDAQLRR